jgi:uncharacterized protein (DUF697 family)
MDNSLQDKEAESIIAWAAARAGVLAAAPVPLVNAGTLMANAVYMTVKLGKVYGREVTFGRAAYAIGGVVGGYLVPIIAFTAILPLVPLTPLLLVSFAVTGTYSTGMALLLWIKDGTPLDTAKYREEYRRAKAEAKERVDELKNDPRRDTPLGDERKKF